MLHTKEKTLQKSEEIISWPFLLVKAMRKHTLNLSKTHTQTLTHKHTYTRIQSSWKQHILTRNEKKNKTTTNNDTHCYVCLAQRYSPNRLY